MDCSHDGGSPTDSLARSGEAVRVGEQFGYVVCDYTTEIPTQQLFRDKRFSIPDGDHLQRCT
jgi:hypothetical protein